MSVSENKGVFMNIALCGIHGAMGKILKDEIEQSDENKLVGYFSPRNGITGQDISEKIDVIIDFSRPENIDFLLDYALKNKVALVICTTGYTDEQIEKIKKAGENIRILLSSNTSIGINILRKIAMLISPTIFPALRECTGISDFPVASSTSDFNVLAVPLGMSFFLLW